MANWNVQSLTSRDRVKSISIDRTLGQPTLCTFQMEKIVVDQNETIISAFGLQPIVCIFETAIQNPTLAPFIQQISTGFEGLAEALYLEANPDATISQ
jgi:hypothetical protein